MLNIDSGNMAVADAILALVKSEGRNTDVYSNTHFSLEPMMNGREKGWVLSSFIGGEQVAVAFAEHRKSDDIVIYIGESRDFSAAGNVPSEEVYAGVMYYKGHHQAKAAGYILGWFAGKIAQAADNDPLSDEVSFKVHAPVDAFPIA